MKIIKNLPIKWKLILVQLFVALFVIILFDIFIIFNDQRLFRQSIAMEIKSMTKLMIANTKPALLFFDDTAAGKILGTLQMDSRITNAWLYDNRKHLFAIYNQPGYIKFVPSFFEPGIHWMKKDSLIYSEDILDDNEWLGRIHMRMKLPPLSKKILSSALFALLVMLLGLIATFLLSIFTQKFISQPLLRLVNHTKNMTETGDYSVNLEKESQDEIGTLYNSFNDMLQQIKNRDIQRDKAEFEIRKLNRELEQRVEERTAELKKLSIAVEQGPAAVIITNENKKIQYVNQTFTNLTQFTFQEIKDQELDFLCVDEQARITMNERNKTIESGRTWKGDLLYKKKNGESIWVSSLIAPTINDNGNITHFVAVQEDITQRKKTMEELKKAREAAEAANLAKSVFLANMTHEIRTPMNAILGYSQLMKRDESLNQDQRQSIDSINRSGEHLLALINDVLEMSKIEAGRIELNMITFDLYSLIEDVELMFRVRTDSKGLALFVECKPDVPRYIIADEGKLRQVLINLLGNAVKFTDKGKIELKVFNYMMSEKVSIQRESEKDVVMIMFEVKDTGIGIEENDLEKIFQPFEQVRKELQTIGGTGLGLPISRKYAKLMEGDITVTSERGQGSCFCFTFKAKRGEVLNIISKDYREQTIVGLARGKEPIRILVVDDNQTNRDILRRLLEPIGFEIKEVGNGKEAIDIYNVWHPQLILMDLVMPVMSGRKATKQIRQLPGGNEVIVIAISASALEEDKVDVMADGANGFIRKPFREDELFEEIGRHLDIEYIYETNEKDSKREELSTLTKESLSRLPEKLVEELHNATIIGDTQELFRLIEEIKNESTDIAKALLQLVEEYDFDRLMLLFDQDEGKNE